MGYILFTWEKSRSLLHPCWNRLHTWCYISYVGLLHGCDPWLGVCDILKNLIEKYPIPAEQAAAPARLAWVS